MGNQFNYELDDRQIKLTMLSATIAADEDAWAKFKQTPITDAKHFTTITASNTLPKFEIGISRSIIVPTAFIIVIGGLSALLFNFVDFKKKESVSTEVPLEIPEVKTEIKKVVVADEKLIQPKKEALATKTITVEQIVPEKTISIITPVTTLKKEPLVVEKQITEKLKIVEQKKVVEEKPITDTTTTTTKKKKKKKQIVEEMPVITPNTTIINSDPVLEPEIQIQ